MNLRDLITLKNDYAQAIGNYRGVPSVEESLKQIDWAMKLLAQKCHFFDPVIEFTVTASQRLYRFNSDAFSKRVYHPHSFQMGSKHLRDAAGCRPGIWTVKEADAYAPDWRNSTTGEPVRVIYYGNGQIILDPVPNSAAAAAEWFVSAEIIPGYWLTNGDYAKDIDDLADADGGSTGDGSDHVGGGDGEGDVGGGDASGGKTGGSDRELQVPDPVEIEGASFPEDEEEIGAFSASTYATYDLAAEPDIPEAFHELLAVLAAIKAGWPVLDGEMAVVKLRQFNADLAKQIEELAYQNKSQLGSWGATDKGIYNPWMQM